MIDDVIAGSLIFEHLGASTRWLYYALHSQLTGSKYKRYGEFYDGRRGWKFSRKSKNAMYNIFIGTVILLALLVVLVFISNTFY